MKRIVSGFDFLRTLAIRLHLTLALLLQRRAWVILTVDGLLLFYVLILTLLGGGRSNAMYLSTVTVPMILLGIPMLSDTVALERRAGSLSLALSSPGASTYFERRACAAGALILAQCWLIVIALWASSWSRPFPIVPPLVHSAASVAVVVAGVLCWAVRLRSSGAVTFASFLTVCVLSPWLYRAPLVADISAVGAGRFLWPMPAGFLQASAVLSGSALVLYFHARRRLRRPERMLS